MVVADHSDTPTQPTHHDPLTHLIKVPYKTLATVRCTWKGFEDEATAEAAATALLGLRETSGFEIYYTRVPKVGHYDKPKPPEPEPVEGEEEEKKEGEGEGKEEEGEEKKDGEEEKTEGGERDLKEEQTKLKALQKEIKTLAKTKKPKAPEGETLIKEADALVKTATHKKNGNLEDCDKATKFYEGQST